MAGESRGMVGRRGNALRRRGQNRQDEQGGGDDIASWRQALSRLSHKRSLLVCALASWREILPSLAPRFTAAANCDEAAWRSTT